MQKSKKLYELYAYIFLEICAYNGIVYAESGTHSIVPAAPFAV